jgi:predicted cupin superfamily sugar epimerase
MDESLALRQSVTAMQTYTAEALVELLQLSPHPEGGYFRETFRATARVQRLDSSSFGAHRTASTAIYFVLPAGTFSAWHSVRSDEVWHYYDGVATEIHTIDPAGVHTAVVLGRDLAHDERPQRIVPAGWLQAARPVALCGTQLAYSFCGCTVSPGFEFDDFDLPPRADLHRRFPHLGAIIDDLSRP